MQKIYIYIISCLVLCGACFWAGGIGPGKRADGMADRIGDIQEQLDESLGIVGTLREENTELIRINSGLESENIRLTDIIGELQKINERFRDIIAGISDANSNIRQGVEEAQTGIRGVAERIRKIIEENKKAESDNNN